LLAGIIIAIIMIPLGFLAIGFGAPDDGWGLVVYGFLAPLLYGVFGFLGGLLFSWFYNVLARWIGGIEVELEGMPERKVKKR